MLRKKVMNSTNQAVRLPPNFETSSKDGKNYALMESIKQRPTELPIQQKSDHPTLGPLSKILQHVVNWSKNKSRAHPKRDSYIGLKG